jgi:hypothetical protein
MITGLVSIKHLEIILDRIRKKSFIIEAKNQLQFYHTWSQKQKSPCGYARG